MKRKLLVGLLIALFLLSFVLVGCQSGGIPQESYDELKDLYDELASKYQEITSKAKEIKPETPDFSDELAAAQAEIAKLQSEIDDLTDRYVLEGSTPAETAERIIRYYHDTHVYDVVDMFVCADMAAEVWNMLKAQGINALIMVGKLNWPITEITQCDHSWVLAELAPGEYLALETTIGVTKPRSTNPEYYRGWIFDTPAAEKDWQHLAREYNTRVEIVNDIIIEANKAHISYSSTMDIYVKLAEGGASSLELEAQEETMQKWLVIENKLVEIKESMEKVLYEIQDQMEGLATQVF